jgi:pimeloyl-ACP methyl ester carboxylesterase
VAPTFVLVHGSFANSGTWAPVQRELALLGQRSLAVDLPGHGLAASAALADVTLADNVEHVTGIMRQVAGHGPVILVGHSRGGLTLTATGNAIPDLISRIVYVSAWCCVDGTVDDYVRSPEFATCALTVAPAGDPAEPGVVRMNWRTADPATLATLHTALLADGTGRELLAFVNALESDESRDGGGAGDRAHAATWGRVPRTYVRLTQDLSIPLALQDRFIREGDALTPGNPFDVRSIDSSHLRCLIHPQELAALLADLGR